LFCTVSAAATGHRKNEKSGGHWLLFHGSFARLRATATYIPAREALRTNDPHP